MADRRLVRALAAVIVRYLTTVRPYARREIARWRRCAHAIPDPELRREVLRPYDSDLSVEGAAIFAVLQPARARELVPLLIAYVLLWSYVDVVTEREQDAQAQAFGALAGVLSPGWVLAAHRDDVHGGQRYFRGLVQECQAGCERLPSWEVVAPAARRIAAYGAVVQAANHGPDADARLRAWARRLGVETVSWQTLAAGASSPLAIHALMALAADPRATAATAAATTTAYFPTVSALSVLADHLIDAHEDVVSGSLSYVDRYPSRAAFTDEVLGLASLARESLPQLPHGELHVVTFAAMIAMFFSDPCVEAGEFAGLSRTVLQAAGFPASELALGFSLRRRTGRFCGSVVGCDSRTQCI
jgi:tetraprenyl-beta-curcumene synthase